MKVIIELEYNTYIPTTEDIIKYVNELGKDLDWSIEIGEDVHLILQLMQRGHSNRVWDKFVLRQKEYSDGGCNTYRTGKIINDCHQQLIYKHPKYISENGIKIGFDKQEIMKLKIKWKQAYLDSQRTTLENFIK